ncbi:TetR/AcrR family transcriptional regulator [Methanoculleus chikugoensis]|uniref:TetR/AcrR family transcriptional regulator n=1 Tax=Methanoculleus chikugoensis TaxID=118126 RepID=UPI000AF68F07|nr:TetR/AcrR family transcriptional regulator [Methanoculleus chikugoensis]
MDDIAREVELNKATIYLYFKNKEALFATIVLRGIEILKEKYLECMEKDVPGIVKVTLMGRAYYRFSQEYPEYLRLIHFYGSERFSRENPYTAEIGKGYGTCRRMLADAVREGDRRRHHPGRSRSLPDLDVPYDILHGHPLHGTQMEAGDRGRGGVQLRPVRRRVLPVHHAGDLFRRGGISGYRRSRET